MKSVCNYSAVFSVRGWQICLWLSCR